MKNQAQLKEPKQRIAFLNNYRAAVLAVMALLISFFASAQTDSLKYSQINGYGFKYKRMVHDSVFVVPLSTSPHTPYRAGGLRYRASDSTLQIWTGHQWNSIITGVGNGVDTAYALNDSTIAIETPDQDFFVTLPGRYWNLQGVLTNGSTLTTNFTITLQDSLKITSGYVVIDSLRLPSLTAQSDTTTYKPLSIDASGNVSKMSIWPAPPVTTLTSTQIAYGSGTNTITSEAALNYNATTNKLTVDSIQTIKLQADTVKLNKSPVLSTASDTLLTRTSSGNIGKVWNIGVNHLNDGLLATKNTAWYGDGKWQSNGVHTFFKVGEGGSFPANGDSVYTELSLAGYQHYNIYREGVLQYMDTIDGVEIDTATGTITWHPPLVSNERIWVNADKLSPLRGQPFVQFDINTVQNLRAWYDATDASTVTLSTGVSVWADKTTNNADLTPVGGSSGEPAYNSTGGGNNQAYVSFTSGKRMRFTFPAQDTGQITGYMVIRQPVPWAADARIFVYDNVNIGGGAGILVPASLGTYYGYITYDGVAGSPQDLNTGVGDWMVLSFKIRGGAVSSIKKNKLGGSIFAYEILGAGSPTTVYNNVIYLNYFNNAAFDLSEFILVKGEPSSTDEASIKNYLVSKYNITTGNSILYFGDSHTGGIMSGTPTGSPYYMLTAKEKNYNFMNYAVSGTVVYPANGYNGISNRNLQDVYNQFDQPIVNNNPIIALQFGTNDGTAPTNPAWVTAYKSYIQHFIDLGIPPSRIIICSPPYNTHPTYLSNLTATEAVVSGIASDMGLQYCDFWHYLQGLGLDINAVSGGDDIHGNGPIHRAMADLLKTFIP